MNEIKFKLYLNRFNDKLANFKPKDLIDISSEREYDNEGDPKASGLILEIALLCAFFASKSLKKSISNEDASYAAYLGWQLSDEIIYGDDKASARHLAKLTKKAQKYYKTIGIKLDENAVSWLIFCCAMIREKFYADIHYEMLGFVYDDEDEKVRVMFEKQKIPELKPTPKFRDHRLNIKANRAKKSLQETYARCLRFARLVANATV